MTRSPRLTIRHALVAMGLLALACAVVACASSRGRRSDAPESGFLRDYSQLQPEDGWPAQEVYFNPNAQWSRYDSIQLDSVTLWTNEDTGKLSDTDRQMLTDTLFTALHEELSKYFEVSDQPGPDTIRVRAALTQAKGAKTALRALSSIHPGTLLVGAAVGLSLDTATSVGSATVEFEVLDAVTNERLAAAVDQRAGTKAFALIAPKRTFTKWGDVKAVSSYWAERAVIVLLKQGVRPKPGAPPPPKG
ncbi:MAG: DUF3313 domain-containing protein [Planctomycetota bacterium]|jgi:hypothetical protein